MSAYMWHHDDVQGKCWHQIILFQRRCCLLSLLCMRTTTWFVFQSLSCTENNSQSKPRVKLKARGPNPAPRRF